MAFSICRIVCWYRHIYSLVQLHYQRLNIFGSDFLSPSSIHQIKYRKVIHGPVTVVRLQTSRRRGRLETLHCVWCPAHPAAQAASELPRAGRASVGCPRFRTAGRQSEQWPAVHRQQPTSRSRSIAAASSLEIKRKPVIRVAVPLPTAIMLKPWSVWYHDFFFHCNMSYWRKRLILARLPTCRPGTFFYTIWVYFSSIISSSIFFQNIGENIECDTNTET